MKQILFIVFIAILIAYVVGCDEMTSQVMKPTQMTDTDVPGQDEPSMQDDMVTSMGSMKDPPAETETSQEDTSDTENGQSEKPATEEDMQKEDKQMQDPPSETQTQDQMQDPPSETQTQDQMQDPPSETQTQDQMQDPPSETQTQDQMQDPPSETQTPSASLVSASPSSGDISEDDSITITFDNDPGDVTTSAGTVAGSGTYWTISGPFPVGALTLTITWTNGDGSHTLTYNVVASDNTSPSISTSSTADGAVDVDPESVSNSGITITFDEPVTGELVLTTNGVNVGWTATINGNTIKISANAGQELSHETTYLISGTVRDSAGNRTEVSITFTTAAAPKEDPPPEKPSTGEGLNIGTAAPDFTLPDGSGSNYTLSDYIGDSKIVLVFFRGNF